MKKITCLIVVVWTITGEEGGEQYVISKSL
jgi:hypothetical protein